MNDDSHNRMTQAAPEGLDEALREAVDQVKSDPVPQTAQQRAVDKACALGEPALPLRPRRRRQYLAAAAVAAAVLLPPVFGILRPWEKDEDGNFFALRRWSYGSVEGNITDGTSNTIGVTEGEATNGYVPQGASRPQYTRDPKPEPEPRGKLDEAIRDQDTALKRLDVMIRDQ